jgi:DMSO reductase anchor subunit
MNPAWSVILLTVLSGLGQGVFVMVLLGHIRGATPHFLILGTVATLVLCGFGLLASFFHLGRPERAWRAVSQWRTSWLSREVIALPLFMALVFVYGTLGLLAEGRGTTVVGTLALFACIALWICTAMIYACIRFIQEWASPYTLANFVLLSLASGATLGLVLAAFSDWTMVTPLARISVVLTIGAGLVRALSLRRNARLKPKSTLQTAIGFDNPRITQRSMGATGGTFNTREFFHGRTLAFLRSIRMSFLILTFVLPVLIVVVGLASGASGMIFLALPLQLVGLLLERWFFFAQANHSQNLYYQVVS